MSVYLHGDCLECGRVRHLDTGTQVCADCAAHPGWARLQRERRSRIIALLWVAMIATIIFMCSQAKKEQATRTNPVLLEETSHAK